MNHKRHDSHCKIKSRRNYSQVTGIRTEDTSEAGELCLRRNQGAFWGDGNILYFDLGGGHPDVQMCKNSSGCKFKICVFTVCRLHLNKNLKIVS